MAYAVKYVFTFQSVGGTTREIRILKDGYSGDPIRRALGRAPILKKQQNGPVHGTSLEMYAECHVDQEFIEFYTSDPKEYRVELYAGNALLWQGWITPELYSEPDIAPPYDVQVVATDGVGELKLYDFAAQGMVSLRAMLTYLLGKTGLSTDVFLVSSLKAGSAGAGALLDMEANFDYLVGKTCYEALSYLLTTLHATITWWGGHWMLVRENNVTFMSGKVRYFNTAGNSALLANSVQELGSMYQDAAWPVGQLSTVIDPAKNKVVVQAPWHPVTALQNSDMASDASWNKSGVTYDSTKGAYFFARDVIMAGELAQSVAFGGLRVPMRMTLSGCGTSETGSGFTGTGNGWVGLILKFQDGDGNVYYLGVDGDGNRRWELYDSGRIPRAFEQDLLSVDTDRENADRIELDIPALAVDGGFPSGTLTVGIWGGAVYVFSAHLDVVLNKGYQDILHIDNGARGEGDDTEIAFGRVTSDVAYYQAFVQGILLNNGALITAFSDANFTTGMDFLSFISRDYARSVALPRARVEGTVSLESSVQLPPLVFTKGGLDYWLETWSWNLYEDELQISARTLPTATLTVESETITEAGGTASTGSSAGGTSSTPAVGLNYFEPNEDRASLIQLKPAYDYLGPRKGLVFGETAEADVENSPAHLMLRNFGTAQNQKYALYTPFALVTGGDQIVIDGEPGGGGGGGGVMYLSELMDVKKNLAPSVNDILVWRNNVSRNDGTTAPGWTNMTKSTFLSGYATQTWVTGQINDILSSVLKFQGTTTTAISDGSTTNPIIINGASYTAQKGDVVLYDGKEYLWQGSSWEQLGDESSWALKTTKIQAGTGLTGGGTLASNRTISLSSASIASLALADTAYQKPQAGIPKTDLASAVQTNITNGATAYSYFTNGVANSAARLSGNTAYSVWGVEFWSNGLPKSATAQPNLYVGDTKVATSAQTAMNIGGLGNLTLANDKLIRWLSNPAEGETAQAINAIELTSNNTLTIGYGVAGAGYNSYFYGNAIYLRTGTTRTNALTLTNDVATMYRTFVPNVNNTKDLGSASLMWRYTYTKRVYLTSSVYLEYVDNSGNGYVHINAPLVTDGDQIVVSGTPGGGGSGGVNWLYELQDVDQTLSSPTGGMVLQYDATSHLWKGAASDTIGITTAGTVAELNAANPTTAKRVWSPSVLASWLAGKNYITGADAVSNVAVGGTGHTDELAITKNGSTSYITVPYANTVKRFKRYAGTDEVGGYDLNTLLSGGGITSQYNRSDRWANRPDSMSFGGVLQINPNTNNTLSMQLAWDVVDNRTQEIYKTGKMWWRDYNAITGWGSWHILYDNASLLLNGAEGGESTLTFFAPTAAGTAGQILKSGGANTAPAWTSSALGAANKPVYLDASGVLTEGSACVTLAGAQTITGAKTHSANLTLNNAVGLYCKDTNGNSVEAVSMSTSNTLRFGYGNRLAGTTGLFGKTFRIGTTDTAAGPDIYIGGLSSTHNTDAANIYFHSTLASGAVRNGVKVAAEHVASADRLNLSVYTSNNATSPYAPSWNKTLEVTYDGKVNIGAPSFSDGALNVNGAIVSAGDQVIASDERIKRNFKPIELSVEQIASCRAASFDWASGGHSFGSVAQDWEPMVPEAVKQGDIKTLAYGQLALVAAINIAKHETEQDEEIRRLRERVADLENEVKRLRA